MSFGPGANEQKDRDNPKEKEKKDINIHRTEIHHKEMNRQAIGDPRFKTIEEKRKVVLKIRNVMLMPLISMLSPVISMMSPMLSSNNHAKLYERYFLR